MNFLKSKKQLIILSAALLITLAGCNQNIIKPASTLPKTTPWDLKALSKAPDFTWLDTKHKIWSLTYEGPDFEGKPTSVFAYYATPDTLARKKTDRVFPGIVLVHGGGGKAFPQWAENWAKRGYAAIAMDLKGYGKDNKPLPDGGPDMNGKTQFRKASVPINAHWQYHDIANVIAAHSLIRTFPEVDPKRTAITGISWGGYTTCIIAGLDNRFKVAVPVYGCGFLHENSQWKPTLDEMSPKDRNFWIQYWEPSQYVGSATMPMFFVNGAKDRFYRPDSYMKTYNLVKPYKNIRIDPAMAHGYGPPWMNKELKWFIDHYIKGTAPLAKIGPVKIINDKATADVTTKTKLVSAKLHYTTDSPPNKERKWLSFDACLNGNTITADLPPKDTKLWFLTVTDDRPAMTSSEIMFSN
ncbi:MAG: alpha/beta hydrolase family protein [Planctomycetota bacterium]|jgi:cephalosporin-C deacetylase-like acetyl esterase